MEGMVHQTDDGGEFGTRGKRVQPDEDLMHQENIISLNSLLMPLISLNMLN
jgi:hypothetical protein